ncbi:G-protein coupled receptor GRL101-like [Ptychodera flava]|uniref:G-protein coupled receptor GRL101-like n=1 Tax=Ptychodera flava TaxID=63121 RepID=UPI00396AAEC5
MTFYCDFIDHCGDNSDEESCVHQDCTTSQFECGNDQCIEKSKRCNLIPDCLNGQDEECDECGEFECNFGHCIPSSAKFDGEVDCGGGGREDEKSNNAKSNNINSQTCPPENIKCKNTHCSDGKWECVYDIDEYGYPQGCRDASHLRNCSLFNCPDDKYKCHDAYCIPLHRRCDGVFDCPYGSDEQGCEIYNCTGSYQCHGMKNCITLSQRCDNIKHCAYGDDELLCDLQCPSTCKCFGAIIDCSHQEMKSLPGNGSTTDIRKMNMTGNDINLIDDKLQYYPLLGELDLMNNSISEIRPRKFEFLVNLYFLRLSSNSIRRLLNHTFYGMRNLKTLDLADNMITHIVDGAFEGLDNLRVLFLTGNNLLLIV